MRKKTKKWKYARIFSSSASVKHIEMESEDRCNHPFTTKKKRVTAGEVDKFGKELGNCTHQ